MIIIGEKLNSSIKSVRAAIAERNADFVKELAKKQAEGGAKWIDINAAMLPDENESLVWLGETCRGAVDLPLCIDTPNPAAARYAIEKLGGNCMINSITLDEDRYAPMVAVAKEFDCAVVALCMVGSGVPNTAEERINIAVKLRDALVADGIAEDKIYIDPTISPIGAVETAGADALAVISYLSANTKAHIVCGLSNISYGIPARPYVNRAFLIAAMAAGLDAAICDPLDRELMRLCLAAEAMLGRDEYCENYIDAYRDGFFE